MMFPAESASVEAAVILNSLDDANRAVLDKLIPLVYQELHSQAHRYLRNERPNHTLQTTALINEVYLRMVKQKDVQLENRAHFLGLAANMMRRILVDYARAKQNAKRGGKNEDVPLDEAISVEVAVSNEKTQIDLILLDEALNKLFIKDEQEARIVELRYFSGLTVEETAEVLGISTMTVKRDWKIAKAWLKHELDSN